jgi:hypothetical protein
MRRKHNPHVALVALLLLALIVTWICGGCAVQTEASENFPVERFTTKIAGFNIRIITDNETGVQYLVYGNTYGLGVTKLEAE